MLIVSRCRNTVFNTENRVVSTVRSVPPTCCYLYYDITLLPFPVSFLLSSSPPGTNIIRLVILLARSCPNRRTTIRAFSTIVTVGTRLVPFFPIA